MCITNYTEKGGINTIMDQIDTQTRVVEPLMEYIWAWEHDFDAWKKGNPSSYCQDCNAYIMLRIQESAEILFPGI
ncbi:MAG: hypothetical protein AB3N16_15665 [Flavobacteriaceae bacterium]